METVGFFFATAAYLAGWALYLVNFETQAPAFFNWGKKFVFAGFLAHLAVLAAAVWGGDLRGSGILSHWVAPFLILSTAVFMEWRYKTRIWMLFSLPVVLLFCVLAFVLKPEDGPAGLQVVRSGGYLAAHTGFILSGFAGMITAVLSAAMYLVQSYQLKSKRVGNFFLKLPALDTLDRIHFRSLALGVVLFSLGILSGLFWAKNLRELHQVFRDPKVVLSFLTCLAYWLVLGFRMSALSRGQKIAAGTVITFALLVATFVTTHDYAPPGGF
ncbi:MAG: cytochrome c biogenesis protein CcsA [Candidatus Omnitrophica bacterium]|nr:cytochrome c biogenesis protein CcsA [Candidatus Omnitrophota bacterium]